MTNKRCKLTDRQIICLFRYHKPKSLAQIRKLNIKLEYFDSGLDRRVFLAGKGLIVKYDNDSFQTKNEVTIMRKIHSRRKYISLRKHVPKVLYSSLDYRILLTHFYPGGLEEDNTEHLSKINYFQELVSEVLGNYNDCDLHSGNFRFDKNGNIICVDLGMERI